MNDKIFSISSLYKSFGDKSVLEDITLDIFKNDFMLEVES